MPAKRIVILGCGYVGSEIARQALSRGMQVTALTRNESTATALRTSGAGVVVADLATDAWHAEISSDVDYVLNCVSSGGGGAAGYQHSYVDGMRSMLAWAEKRGQAGTIVYTSSTAVYPESGGGCVDETTLAGGEGERARWLLEAERWLREGGARASERYFILRLAGIYGPGRSHLLGQVRAGEVAGRGEIHLNLIHRDDVCAAIWAAFTAFPTVANEIFNVADDGRALKADVVAWLASRVGVPLPRFTGAPASGRRGLTPDRIIANDKIKTQLGWRPGFADFRAGYENMLALHGE